MPRILVVVVLYRMLAKESLAFCSFCAALERHPALRNIYELNVYDNSPEPQILTSDCAVNYTHDATNPGLAKPYMCALQRAIDIGTPWLMLLDQDTVITASYLVEAAELTETLATSETIAILVPKLVEHGIVQSPHMTLAWRPTRPIAIDAYGASPQELLAFNSGAILRISALRLAGGFPLSYPLDFLDHATLRLLQRRGGKLYLMDSALQHSLSLNESYRAARPEVSERMRHTFQAELRFYSEMGTPHERLIHRIRLLCRAAKSLRLGAFRRMFLFLRLATTFLPSKEISREIREIHEA